MTGRATLSKVSNLLRTFNCRWIIAALNRNFL
jgi:hypothetical protein